jgi:hypothetical protein
MPAGGPFFEVLTAEELAQRWRVPPSWVREQSRSRCSDPIPHARLGRYVRFSWGEPGANPVVAPATIEKINHLILT